MSVMPRTTTASPTARLAPAKQIAREYGLAYTTLRDLVLRGEVPLTRVGRAWYLARRDMDVWLAAHTERVS